MKGLLFCFLFLFCVGCNHVDDDFENMNKYLPKKIYRADGYTEFYTYDANDFLTHIEILGGASNFVKSYDFTYEAGKITDLEVVYHSFNDDYGYQLDYDFSYNVDSRSVVVSVSFLEKDGFSEYYQKFFTINELGDLISSSDLTLEYDEFRNVLRVLRNGSTEDVVYDNKNGFFKNVKNPRWIYVMLDRVSFLFGANNPIEVHYFNGGVEKYEYEYNSAGYPIVMKITFLDFSQTELNIEYEIR